MEIALWIISGITALLYIVAGSTKAFSPKRNLAERMPWSVEMPAWQVKFIGIVEILGALGLILPALTGIAPILTPIAAIGLVIIQVFAIVLHVRRGEQKSLPFNVVLLVLPAFIAVGRLFLVTS